MGTVVPGRRTWGHISEMHSFGLAGCRGLSVFVLQVARERFRPDFCRGKVRFAREGARASAPTSAVCCVSCSLEKPRDPVEALINLPNSEVRGTVS